MKKSTTEHLLPDTVTYKAIEEILDFNQDEEFDGDDGMPEFRDRYNDETKTIILKSIKSLFDGEPAFEVLGYVELNCDDS